MQCQIWLYAVRKYLKDGFLREQLNYYFRLISEFSFPINNRGCYYAESAAVPANGCHEVSNLNEMKSALDDIIVSVKSDLSLKNFQGTRCLAKETYGDMSSAASYFYKLPLNLVIGNVLVMFVRVSYQYLIKSV